MYELWQQQKVWAITISFGLWNFYLNSPKGYSKKIINAQTDAHIRWCHTRKCDCTFTVWFLLTTWVNTKQRRFVQAQNIESLISKFLITTASVPLTTVAMIARWSDIPPCDLYSSTKLPQAWHCVPKSILLITNLNCKYF